MRRLVPLTALAAAALAVTACAPSEGTSAAAASPTGGPCSPDQLQTLEPGTLTAATDPTAYEPWMLGNDPTNGQGFESAVAYAVAEQLGYAREDVTWVRVPFNAALQPGNQPFDFDINQFRVSDERRQVVDFSSPYYTVTQAVLTTTGSAADGAKNLADLRSLRLGAPADSPSLDTLQTVIQPGGEPVVFDNPDDATRALEAGEVDAIVVDLPTAFSLRAAQMTNGVIVGQVPTAGGGGDQFGLLFQKDSPVEICVNQAVDALQADGTLADLEKQWLSDVPQVRVLR